jgi:N-acyl-D-aspartate/D-glutamate deacylase
VTAKNRPVARAATLACLAAVAAAACRQPPEFDLVIRNGTVVDGNLQRIDVGIKGDRITALGDLAGRGAAESIDATGQMVAPGFIDVLSRSGIELLSSGNAERSLRQGITSEILADHSPAFWTAQNADALELQRRSLTLDWRGLQGYFDRIEARGPAVNIGTLVPLSARATAESTIDAALGEGAFGVVDDVVADALTLTATATTVGQRDSVLVVPMESAVAADDATLDATGARAHRIVVTGLERTTSAQLLTDLSLRVQRAAQRGVTVWPAVTIPSPAAGEIDSLLVDALHKGSLVAAGGRGAFPRFLGQIARDEHTLEMAEAVRRITSMPASAFQIPERGNVREHYFADLVIFDPQKIADPTTAGDPNANPVGIDYVVVNGVVVLTPRGPTGARPGYPLLRQRATR